jgi:hypothetical protein
LHAGEVLEFQGLEGDAGLGILVLQQIIDVLWGARSAVVSLLTASEQPPLQGGPELQVIVLEQCGGGPFSRLTWIISPRQGGEVVSQDASVTGFDGQNFMMHVGVPAQSGRLNVGGTEAFGLVAMLYDHIPAFVRAGEADHKGPKHVGDFLGAVVKTKKSYVSPIHPRLWRGTGIKELEVSDSVWALNMAPFS